ADVMASVAERFGDHPATDLAVERALPVLGDLAVLITVEGDHTRYVAGAHIDPDKRPILDQLMERYPPQLDGPGFAPRALRERQSLLVQAVNREVARSYGITDEQFTRLTALRIRSAMAVPLLIRSELRGAMVFASSSRRFEPDDLSFAEVYARRV